MLLTLVYLPGSTVPMYQSELCKAEWRGRIVAWEIWFIGIGIVLAYWIDYGFSFVPGEAGWRTPIALQLVFAVIVVFIVWGLPESPRWLAKRGREDEAAQVICDVFDLRRDDPYVLGEMEAIRAAIAIETGEGAGKALGIFKKDKLQTRWRVFLAWFGLFMNQWSGGCSRARRVGIAQPVTDLAHRYQPRRLLHAYCARRERGHERKASATDCWVRT